MKYESFLSLWSTVLSAVRISDIHRNHSTLFDLARSFDDLCIRVLSDEKLDKVHDGGNQRLIAAVLFARTLKSFEAIYKLAELGMQEDARTILRSMAETVICLVAVGKNDKVCDLLVEKDEFNQRRMGNAWLGNPQASNEMAELDKNTIKESIANISVEKDPIVIANLAKQAGVEVLYETIFRSASSDATHVTLKALSNGHIEENAEGEVKGLKFGPNADNLKGTLLDAMSAMSFAIDAIIKLFQIQDVKNKFDILVKNWSALSNDR